MLFIRISCKQEWFGIFQFVVGLRILYKYVLCDFTSIIIYFPIHSLVYSVSYQNKMFQMEVIDILCPIMVSFYGKLLLCSLLVLQDFNLQYRL
jgi:hypothetical protein